MIGSFSIMFWPCIHYVVWIGASVLDGRVVFRCVNAAIFCLPIHQLKDIWTVPTFWLLWIMPLWTFLYKFSRGHMFSILLGINLGVEFLGFMFNFLRNCQTGFFFLRFYLFLERGKEREEERETNISVREKYQLIASHTPPTRNLACNPGMYSDWESNQQPFNFCTIPIPLRHTSQGSY